MGLSATRYDRCAVEAPGFTVTISPAKKNRSCFIRFISSGQIGGVFKTLARRVWVQSLPRYVILSSTLFDNMTTIIIIIIGEYCGPQNLRVNLNKWIK